MPLPFYVPKSKAETIKWMKEHYPNKEVNWNKYDAKRLRAIYINFRIRTR